MTWWTRTKHSNPAHNPYFQPGLMTLLQSVTDFAGSVTTAQVVGSVAALSALSFARWYAYNLKVRAHTVLHLEMILRDVWLVLRNPHDCYSEPLMSWISAIHFITEAREMVHEGYMTVSS